MNKNKIQDFNLREAADPHSTVLGGNVGKLYVNPPWEPGSDGKAQVGRVGGRKRGREASPPAHQSAKSILGVFRRREKFPLQSAEFRQLDYVEGN